MKVPEMQVPFEFAQGRLSTTFGVRLLFTLVGLEYARKWLMNIKLGLFSQFHSGEGGGVRIFRPEARPEVILIVRVRFVWLGLPHCALHEGRGDRLSIAPPFGGLLILSMRFSGN